VMLGGIRVPHTHGISAHSDGDIVLHAITDALLGALGMGDIGQWFPDNDPDLNDISSKDLIMLIIMSMRGNGYELNNLDVTIVAQVPHVMEHSDAIRKSIATIFSCEIDRINIKATSTEKLGAIGRKEGISAHAVISIIGKTQQDEKLETLLEDTATLQTVNEITIGNIDGDDEIDLSQEIDIREFNFDDIDDDAV
ncbi:MAG: 2-C-methyl-D-erythritol 2,4-cyclodiphosphate synthase, partial [Gammaproteobacteria bacterium]|nr:2-C-methyl-D-erythritol 2,4-cyclodiphosphate synthase [Gammaproteobacteria bacterium]